MGFKSILFSSRVNKVHPSYIQDLTKDPDFDVNDKVSLIDSLGSINFENFQNSESYNPILRSVFQLLFT